MAWDRPFLSLGGNSMQKVLLSRVREPPPTPTPGVTRAARVCGPDSSRAGDSGQPATFLWDPPSYFSTQGGGLG